jgi:hypothetical protein
VTLPASQVNSTNDVPAGGGEVEDVVAGQGTPEQFLTLGPSTLIVGIATAVLTSATLLVELAPYGPLGRLLVGDVDVEASRVFKELQA